MQQLLTVEEGALRSWAVEDAHVQVAKRSLCRDSCFVLMPALSMSVPCTSCSVQDYRNAPPCNKCA
jgi:hypothetical protein